MTLLLSWTQKVTLRNSDQTTLHCSLSDGDHRGRAVSFPHSGFHEVHRQMLNCPFDSRVVQRGGLPGVPRSRRNVVAQNSDEPYLLHAGAEPTIRSVRPLTMVGEIGYINEVFGTGGWVAAHTANVAKADLRANHLAQSEPWRCRTVRVVVSSAKPTWQPQVQVSPSRRGL
jgi:hypothetical protein